MRCKVRLPDHTGDSIVAEYEPTNAASVQIADKALADFFDECIEKYGKNAAVPLVTGRELGDSSFRPLDRIDGRFESVVGFEELLLVRPLSGG